MCLAIPAQIVELVDRDDGNGKGGAVGVRRNVSLALCPEAQPGDWVLVHVGFALQQIDEERGARDACAPRAAWARSTSRSCVTSRECVAVTARSRDLHHVRRRRRDRRSSSRSTARRRPSRSDGRREQVGIELVAPVRRGRAASLPRRHRPDEGRGRRREVRRRVPLRRDRGRVTREIESLVEPGETVSMMEVCGGHTHTIYRHGLEDLVPTEVEFVHGPGLPGLRDPDGTCGRRDRARGTPRRRSSRRSATCSACPAAAARCSKQRREGPTCAWSTRPSTRSRSRARTRNATSSSSPSASRRPPRRRRSRAPCARRGAPQLLRLRQPRDDRAAAPSDSRRSGTPARRVHRAGSRVDRHRHASVRLHPRGVRKARRRRGVRADRRPPLGRHGAPPAARRPLRGREPVHAGRSSRRKRAGDEPRSTRRWSCATRSSGVAWARFRRAPSSSRPEFADVGRRAPVRPARRARRRTRRLASAARC